jgi:hypothetical protein
LNAVVLLLALLSPTTLGPLPREKPLAVPQAKPVNYVITDETEIEVDGKRCGYEDVPERAEMILLSIGKDGKTVLKLHFKTKK